MPEVRDGRLYGRGACDMKGGIAAMTLAAETLAQLGIGLAGDVVLATNTDEESSGAGGTALCGVASRPMPESSPSPPASGCGWLAGARSTG